MNETMNETMAATWATYYTDLAEAFRKQFDVRIQWRREGKEHVWVRVDQKTLTQEHHTWIKTYAIGFNKAMTTLALNYQKG